MADPPPAPVQRLSTRNLTRFNSAKSNKVITDLHHEVRWDEGVKEGRPGAPSSRGASTPTRQPTTPSSSSTGADDDPRTPSSGLGSVSALVRSVERDFSDFAWLREPQGWLLKPDFKRPEQQRQNFEKRQTELAKSRFWETGRSKSLIQSAASHLFFHRRYFRLSATELSYYKAITDDAKRGSINLAKIEDVRLSRVQDAPAHAIDLICADRVFTVAADTREELGRWALAICKRLDDHMDQTVKTASVEWKAFEVRLDRPCSVSFRPVRAPDEHGTEALWVVVEEVHDESSLKVGDVVVGVNESQFDDLNFEERLECLRHRPPLTLRCARDVGGSVVAEGWGEVEGRRRYFELMDRGELVVTRLAKRGKLEKSQALSISLSIVTKIRARGASRLLLELGDDNDLLYCDFDSKEDCAAWADILSRHYQPSIEVVPSRLEKSPLDTSQNSSKKCSLRNQLARSSSRFISPNKEVLFDAETDFLPLCYPADMPEEGKLKFFNVMVDHCIGGHCDLGERRFFFILAKMQLVFFDPDPPNDRATALGIINVRGARVHRDDDLVTLEIGDLHTVPLRPAADVGTWFALLADRADDGCAERAPASTLLKIGEGEPESAIVILGELRFCMVVKERGEFYCAPWAACLACLACDELRLYSLDPLKKSDVPTMLKSPLALARLLSVQVCSGAAHRFELEVADVTATSGRVAYRYEAPTTDLAERHVRTITVAAERALHPNAPRTPPLTATAASSPTSPLAPV